MLGLFFIFNIIQSYHYRSVENFKGHSLLFILNHYDGQIVRNIRFFFNYIIEL